FYNAINFVPWRLNPKSSLGCGNADTTNGTFAPGNIQGLGASRDITSGAIVAQEVSHNFGLVMNSSTTSNGNAHSINEIVLAPSGGVTETRGFNIITRRAITEPHTVMQGSCCEGMEQNDTQLFEPADFPQLSSSILSLASSGTTNLAAANAQPVFSLIGTI